MFVAAMLDAWPELDEGLERALSCLPLPSDTVVEALAADDHHIGGKRFKVVCSTRKDHKHRHWREINAMLESSDLAPNVRDVAIAIFTHLAEAEAAIHRAEIDEVAFHEVGAWDSIIDFVAAAYLIDAIGPASWHVGSLPLGRGTTTTQHGVLPVLAPATVRLLDGFEFHDDGRAGERVTPTGAAIMKQLSHSLVKIGPRGRLERYGHGFGTKRFADMPNMLRVTAFHVEQSSQLSRDRVAVLECEIDDQTPEDLALAIDFVRNEPGVRDVIQIPGFGKKGRMVVCLRILADPNCTEAVAERLVEETTTLGIRVDQRARLILDRTGVERDGKRLKRAERPGGPTAKLESDELRDVRGHAARQRRRKEIENEPS